MLDGNSLARGIMEDQFRKSWLMVAAVIGAIVLSLAAWVVPSYFEAQAYNRVTGSNVSTWDAMWIELRVQGGSKD
jgi:multisubunit Na+/H+ antiporter MnhB subunit